MDLTGTDDARRVFIRAQRRVLDRYGVTAKSRFVSTPTLGGDTHVLVTGDGPPVMMVIGGGMVAGLWAPLLARLKGFTLYALDPPGHGLTAPMAYHKDTMRHLAVEFLTEVLDGLRLDGPPFISQSVGGLWTTWLAIDRPERVSAISYIACPAIILGTSAPLPLRISTIRSVRAFLNAVDPPSRAQVLRIVRMNREDLSDTPELVDLFKAYELIPGAAESLLDLHRALLRLRGPRPELQLTVDHLARVVQPIQLIWGKDDPYGPPSVGERVIDIVDDASLHVVSGGHGPWFDQSELVASLIAPFLAGKHPHQQFH